MGTPEKIVPQWRAFYSDGLIFDDSHGSSLDMPPYDVQVIVQKNEDVGLQFVTGDFYLFIDGTWIGVDFFGLIDHLAAQGIVKVGRFLPNHKWKQVQAEAMKHYDAMMKSASLRTERFQ